MDDPKQASPNPSPLPQSFLFGRAVIFEGSLLLVAFVLAWILGVPLLADLRWDLKAALLGISSALPLLALFAWMLQSDAPAFVEIREFLDTFVSQLFGQWTVAQMAILSLVAGIGEEILFRGVLQPGISNFSSPLIGLLVASFVFAVCHALTKAYFVTTFFIGIYLSLVWQASDNLLAPIVTHAVYDFGALFYFLRWHVKSPPPKKDEAGQ